MYMDICLLPIQRGGSLVDRAVYGALLTLHQRVCPPYNAGRQIITSIAFDTQPDIYIWGFFPIPFALFPLFPSRLEVASQIHLKGTLTLKNISFK